MDEDKYIAHLSTIKERALAFEKKLTTLHARNSELLTSIINVQKEYKEIFGTKRFCTVCYVREPCVALNCGHVFSLRCVQKAKERNRCFTCRKNIESTIRLYL